MGSILKSLDETKLLSLKTKEYTGKEPFIVKEIPDERSRPAGTGNIFQRTYNETELQVTRRADDVIRITKLLASPAGIKFTAKQQLINTTVNQSKKLGKVAGLEQTAKTLAIILAQTAISGTSIHLRSVTDEFTYLRRNKATNEIQKNLPVPVESSLEYRSSREINPPGEDRVESVVYREDLDLVEDLALLLNHKYVGKYGNRYREKIRPNSPDAIDRASHDIKYYLEPTPENSAKGISKLVENLPYRKLINPRVTTKQFVPKLQPNLTSDFGGLTEQAVNIINRSIVGDVAVNGYDYIYEAPNSPDELKPKKPYTPGVVHSKPYKGQDIRSKEINVRLKMSKNNTPAFKTAGTTDGVDQINYLEPVTSENPDGNLNLIPFKIVLYRANKPPTYLYFRAHLDSMNDQYGGQWNSVQYIGRGETFNNFSVFSRNISFGFLMAAYSEAELLPLYQKMNELVGSTAPSYTEAKYSESPFMKGNFVRLTIGEYFHNIPGFFNSITLNWSTEYPWEIKYDNLYDVTPIVPHILSVQCQFLPIHDFAAESGQPFIGRSDIMTLQKPAVFFNTVPTVLDETDFSLDDINLTL